MQSSSFAAGSVDSTRVTRNFQFVIYDFSTPAKAGNQNTSPKKEVCACHCKERGKAGN